MNKHKRLKGLPPIVEKRTKVLILGSFPSPKALEKQEYYGNPLNQFWKIIFDVINTPLASSYRDRVKILKDNKIGIWDIIKSCYREGAADSNMSDIKLNDFTSFIKDNPNIKAIFTNGKKAFELLQGNCKGIEIHLECLPSTSPANAQYDYNYKKGKWIKILKFTK